MARALDMDLEAQGWNMLQWEKDKVTWTTKPKVILKTREAMEKESIEANPWRLLDKPTTARSAASATFAGCPQPSANGGSASCADEAGATANLNANSGSAVFAKARHKLICDFC